MIRWVCPKSDRTVEAGGCGFCAGNCQAHEQRSRWFARLVLALCLLACGVRVDAAVLLQSPSGGVAVQLPSLSAAVTDARAAGGTIRVTSALSAAMSNISSATVHAWPADRKLVIDKGGSIGNTTILRVNGPFEAGMHQAFTGTGAVTFGNGVTAAVRPEWWGVDGTADEVEINKAFASLPDGGVVRLAAKTYNVANSINTTSYCQLIGEYGEDNTYGVTSPKTGSKISWTGATGYIIRVYNVRLFQLSGVHLNGNGADVTGILVDSNNNPSGSQNEFGRFSIRNCKTGVQWGTSGLVGSYANDGTRFTTFTIWSQIAGSKGFIINSGNAGQMSTIESGGIQTEDMGIDIIAANHLQVRRVFGGGPMVSAFIQIKVGIDILVEGCSSEMWGPTGTLITNSTYFLRVISNGGTYPLIQSSITLIANHINNPVLVSSDCRITSVGNSWGQCKDLQLGYYVPTIGSFNGGSSRVIALNDGVDPTITDVTTAEPSHGWISSAYVSVTNLDPGLGWIAPAFASGNFTGSGSMIWTVESGDVETYAYKQTGRSMSLFFKVNTSTVGGTPSNALQIKIPNSKVASRASLAPVVLVDAGAARVIGQAYASIGSDQISIQKLDTSNFTTATNNTAVYGQITFEVQ